MFSRIVINLILFAPLVVFSQPNCTITTNNNPHPGNLFFYVNGPIPEKTVNIMDSSGAFLFSEVFGNRGTAWKVNLNNKISFFDREIDQWMVMDSLQNIVDSVSCKNGYIADFHEFLAQDNGNYVLISYPEIFYATDTIVANGNPNHIITGTVIQELDSNHQVVFEWHGLDHFYLSDYDINFNSNEIDFLHLNAISIDDDNNYVLSNRNISEITKIDRISGDIIWKLGGEQSDFVFTNDYPFSKQHSIKCLGDNRYLLFDNGNLSDEYTGSVKLSRGVEYQLNLNDMTANKIWEYFHPDSLYNPTRGSVQRLDNGNTLINFADNSSIGRGSIFTEVNSINEVVFEMELDENHYVYCANKANWNFYSEPIAQTIELMKLKNEDVLIYPNPTSANFWIKLPIENEAIETIKISDLNGNTIKLLDEIMQVSQGVFSINSDLKPGVYIIEVITNCDIYNSKINIYN